METTNTSPEAPKKETKAEYLTRQIKAAQTRLAALKAELMPLIEAHQEKLELLDKSYRAVLKAGMDAYRAEQVLRREVEAGLFPTTRRHQLEVQLKLFCDSKGLQLASAQTLAREFINEQVSADGEVVAAVAHQAGLDKRQASLYRKRNVLNYDPVYLNWLRQIRDSETALESMEKELERLPGRYQARKDARREQKLEEQTYAEMKTARELVKTEFTFKAED